MGLPKSHRLKKWQNFQKVYRQGKSFKNNDLIIRVLAEDNPNTPTTFGISVSKKVSKKAVIRNLIKRRIKAAIRKLLPEIKSGWQIVIIVKPKINQCEYEHFLRQLKELLQKAEVLHGN